MARPRKSMLEGAVIAAPVAPKHPDPVPGNNGDALARIVAWFRAEYPAEWGDMQRGPLAYGLQQMIEIARGK